MKSEKIQREMLYGVESTVGTFRGFNYMFLSMCDFSYSDYFKHLGSNWDSLYSFATPHICKTSDFSISDNANSCQT
jgi:hypothetical protein